MGETLTKALIKRLEAPERGNKITYDADVPGFSVFTRGNGTTFHYYSGELSTAMADPGQDPRGAPDLDPLWLMLDLTRVGRGTDWYPKLEYKHK